LVLLIAGLLVACIAVAGAAYVNSRSTAKPVFRAVQLQEEEELIAEEAPPPLMQAAIPVQSLAPAPTALSVGQRPLVQPQYRVVRTKATQVYTPSGSVVASTSVAPPQVAPASSTAAVAADQVGDELAAIAREPTADQ